MWGVSAFLTQKTRQQSDAIDSCRAQSTGAPASKYRTLHLPNQIVQLRAGRSGAATNNEQH